MSSIELKTKTASPLSSKHVTAASLAAVGVPLSTIFSSAIARSNWRRWAEGGDPDFLQVLIRQIRQNAEVDIVFGKSVRVLSNTHLQHHEVDPGD